MGGRCLHPCLWKRGSSYVSLAWGGCVLGVGLSAKPSSSPWMREVPRLETLSAVAVQTRFEGWSDAAAEDVDAIAFKLCFSAPDLSPLLIPRLYL